MGFHHVGQASLELLTSECWDYRSEPACLADIVFIKIRFYVFFATTWMQLEAIILTKLIEGQKTKYMLPVTNES